MASSSNNRYEVGSNSAQGLAAVCLDGEPVHRHFHDAVEKFRKAGAVAAARLFAEPDLSVSSVSGRSFYSWLSWTQGPPRPLDALSDHERDFLLRGFGEQIEGLRAIAEGDPFLEGFLQAALVTPDTSCLMELEMRPLLVNWGLVGSDLAESNLDQHFQSGIGGLLERPLHLDPMRIGLAAASENPQPDSDAGPKNTAGFSPTQHVGGAGATIAGVAGAGAAEAADRSTEYGRGSTDSGSVIANDAPPETQSGHLHGDAEGYQHGNPGPNYAQEGVHVAHTTPIYARSWFFPLLALLLALLVLLYLLWPGNLIYASRGALGLGLGLGIAPSTAITDESNAALSQRIDQLQAALADSNNCSFDPALLRRPLSMPPIRPAAGGAQVSPEAAPSSGGAPQDEAQSSPPGGPGNGQSAIAQSESARPEMPSALSSPLSTQPPAPEVGDLSLLETMDQATVLVVAQTSGGSNTGSGFFVDRRTIVTNAHVVNAASGDTVFISNNHIGLRPARVIAKNGGQAPGDADFALLRTESDMDVAPMQVSTSISRLLAVIAAGYPHFVAQGDEAYQRALQGDAEAFKRIQLVVTRGNVTSVQTATAGQLVAHTAQTSPGNSGGPLIDECGRVVGINTFVRSGTELNIQLNFALSTEALFRFASTHGVELMDSPSACAPGPSPMAAAAQPTQQAQP